MNQQAGDVGRGGGAFCLEVPDAGHEIADLRTDQAGAVRVEERVDSDPARVAVLANVLDRLA